MCTLFTYSDKAYTVKGCLELLEGPEHRGLFPGVFAELPLNKGIQKYLILQL